MANVLIISALQIFPVVSGGQHRTASIARELAEAGHQVRVYSLIGRKRDMLRLVGPGEASIAQNLTEFVKRPRGLWLKAMLAYKRGIPPFWARQAIEQPDRKLSKLIAESQVLIFDFPYTFVASSSKSQFRILNSHNIEHRLFQTSNGEKSILAETVGRLEAAAIGGVNLVACASVEEMTYFSALFPEQTFLHVPNCIRFQKLGQNRTDERNEFRRQLQLEGDDKILLFPASRYGPNVEGADFLRRFCIENQAFLRRERIVILVAGSVTNTAERNGQFFATGPVDNMEPYFGVADWGVNPIFHGSGTSVKVAEFIAHDLPILTTEVGARGFKFEDGSTAIFFNEENLLDKLSHLPEDSSKLVEMCNGARAANLHFLDPASAVAPLLDAIGKWTPPP